jgi:hypothetical protein
MAAITKCMQGQIFEVTQITTPAADAARSHNESIGLKLSLVSIGLKLSLVLTVDPLSGRATSSSWHCGSLLF